jgi:hypothetical protein
MNREMFITKLFFRFHQYIYLRILYILYICCISLSLLANKWFFILLQDTYIVVIKSCILCLSKWQLCIFIIFCSVRPSLSARESLSKKMCLSKRPLKTCTRARWNRIDFVCLLSLSNTATKKERKQYRLGTWDEREKKEIGKKALDSNIYSN